MRRWFGRWTLHLGIGAWILAISLAARAQGMPEPDGPSRVGRLVEVQGTAWVYDRDEAAWSQAQPNRPLTTGDRIGTDLGSRLVLRIGSTVVRLAGETDLLLRQLDDRAIAVELWAGSLALRVTSPEVASQIEVTTSEGRLVPGSAGQFRVDRRGEASDATAWRGTLHFEGQGSRLAISTGQRAQLWLQGSPQTAQYRWQPVEQDEFAAWVARTDQEVDRVETARYVSPEMTGAEDLDRYGRWRWHPEYGRVWYPYDVPAGWAPYTLGRWTWVSPWGWTWIDVAPWGFAPFHYGRWVSWGGRWVWAPGPRGARPVYLPATVDWVFPPFVVGVRPPPPSHWKPLPPRQDFRPHPHPVRPADDRVQVQPPPRVDRHVPRGPASSAPGEVTYTNRGVPGGVTSTPRDVFVPPRPGAAPMQGNAQSPTTQPPPRTRYEPAPGASRPSPVPPRRPPPAAAPAAPADAARPTLPAMSPPPPVAPNPPITVPRSAAAPTGPVPPPAAAVRPPAGPPVVPPGERGQRPEHRERPKPDPSTTDKSAPEGDGRKHAPEQNTTRGDRKMVQ